MPTPFSLPTTLQVFTFATLRPNNPSLILAPIPIPIPPPPTFTFAQEEPPPSAGCIPKCALDSPIICCGGGRFNALANPADASTAAESFTPELPFLRWWYNPPPPEEEDVEVELNSLDNLARTISFARRSAELLAADSLASARRSASRVRWTVERPSWVVVVVAEEEEFFREERRLGREEGEEEDCDCDCDCDCEWGEETKGPAVAEGS